MAQQPSIKRDKTELGLLFFFFFSYHPRARTHTVEQSTKNTPGICGMCNFRLYPSQKVPVAHFSLSSPGIPATNFALLPSDDETVSIMVRCQLGIVYLSLSLHSTVFLSFLLFFFLSILSGGRYNNQLTLR